MYNLIKGFLDIEIKGSILAQGGRMMDKLLQEIINWLRMSDEKIVIGISGHGAAGKNNVC